jgi:hypothetical protein
MKLLLDPEGEGVVMLEMSESTVMSQSPPPLWRVFLVGGLGLTIVYVCNAGAVLQLVLGQWELLVADSSAPALHIYTYNWSYKLY